MPEGLIMFSDKEEVGPIVIEESELMIVNGINGSKILVVDEESTFVVRNHRSDKLIFRAVQFEL